MTKESAKNHTETAEVRTGRWYSSSQHYHEEHEVTKKSYYYWMKLIVMMVRNHAFYNLPGQLLRCLPMAPTVPSSCLAWQACHFLIRDNTGGVFVGRQDEVPRHSPVYVLQATMLQRFARLNPFRRQCWFAACPEIWRRIKKPSLGLQCRGLRTLGGVGCPCQDIQINNSS